MSNHVSRETKKGAGVPAPFYFFEPNELERLASCFQPS
jgi:hypothetical protein